jgi:hypothetical protein
MGCNERNRHPAQPPIACAATDPARSRRGSVVRRPIGQRRAVTCGLDDGHTIIGHVEASGAERDRRTKGEGTRSCRLAGADGWVLICYERKVLLTDCWWLVCSERKVMLAGG